MTKLFKGLLVLGSLALPVTVAHAEEPRSLECGASSADLYLRDLTVNSDRPMGYCSVDNDWPLGLQSTVGLSVGEEEQVNNLNIVLSGSASVGLIDFEASGGLYHFWSIEDTVYMAGGEASVEAIDGISFGVSATKYFGDYEDVTFSGFTLLTYGGLDLEFGYSTLDSGNEGLYGEVSYTWERPGFAPTIGVQFVDGRDERALAVVVRTRF